MCDSDNDYYIKVYNTFSLGTNCLQGDIKQNDLRTLCAICKEVHNQACLQHEKSVFGSVIGKMIDKINKLVR